MTPSLMIKPVENESETSQIDIGKTELDTSGIVQPLQNIDELTMQIYKKGKIMKFKAIPEAMRESYFYGMDNNGTSVNVIERAHSDGKICYTGSVNDEKEQIIHQFGCDAKGNLFVHSKSIFDFPEEAHPLPIPVEHGDKSDGDIIKLLGSENTKNRALVDDGSILDIMVVWTMKSECRNSGMSEGCNLTSETRDNMIDRINLAVEETNTAYTLSGIDTQLKLVHLYRDPDYVESSSNAFGKALDQITAKTDGVLDDVHQKREEYKADIVSMIIDDSQYCGLGWIGPNINYMFSVTAWNCATGYYSFGHEIGHNQGCNHDQGTKNACSTSNYNYGYRDPQATFRTIMAYSCRSDQCDNNAGTYCPKIQRFSTPNDARYHNGKPIGTSTADNAKQINSVKEYIAAYFNSNEPNTPTNSPMSSPSKTPITSPTFSPTKTKKKNKKSKKKKKKSKKKNKKRKNP